MGNVKVVKLEIFDPDNEITRLMSEEIVVDENGIVSIPSAFIDETLGAVVINHLTIHLLEPIQEDTEEFHVNIDIIGCAKNIRGWCHIAFK